MNRILKISTGALVLVAAACSGATEAPIARPATPATGTPVAVLDTTIAAVFEASGTATPFAEATLSTRLMGTVTAVLATEGAQVAASAPLVRIDAADLDARDLQATAGIAGAEAAFQDATVTAARIRALYADSAAPKAQLDAAESGLARARAGLAAARAGQAELSAVRSYSTIRAPFAGVISRRLVDVGDFAAPGTPLITVQDVSRLRITASIPASQAGAIRRGAVLRGNIETAEIRATVEGVVPASAGMYTVNAIVANPGARLPSGGAATLRVPSGASERALFVPTAAIIREGDLTGVRIVRAGATELRWIRLGAPMGSRSLVMSGLAAGDSVLVPTGGR